MNSKNRSYLLIAATVILIAGFLTVDFEANEAGLVALPDFHKVTDETTADEVPINTLADINEALTEIVDEVVPSVVTIRVSQTIEIRRNPFPPMFQRFFGMRARPDQPETRVRRGIGSGVIVSEDGYIITNSHVVADAEQIIVTLYNGREFQGEVIGRDPYTDIAVVKIDAEDLNPLPIGDSDEVHVGELVLAVGSPLGQQHSVTLGIVSAKGRTFGRYSLYIQTDAAINPGNSGGALVNMSGQLVGINTAIISQTGGYQGIGLAIPSNIARSIMRSLIEDGEVERGYLGITFGGTVDATMARALDVGINRGIIIGSVQEGTPADEAGLQEGDIIYEINDDPVDGWSELATIIGTSNPGEEIELGIVRDGERIEITVTLGEREGSLGSAVQDQEEDLGQTLGFEIENLTPRLARRLGLEPDQEGVVVTDINPTSDAFRQGLQKGDIIISVSNQTVENMEDFAEALRDIAGEDQVVLLEVIRNGNRIFIAFEL